MFWDSVIFGFGFRVEGFFRIFGFRDIWVSFRARFRVYGV